MKKVFYIDGGAGRIITAMPALLKYAKLHPGEDWNVLIPAWDALYWGIPELQDRTYSTDTKGVFDNIILKATEIISPEPYRNVDYIHQRISLAEAFDAEINKTTDHSDLEKPRLVYNNYEKYAAMNTIADIKNAQKKQKTIVIQPFGRGAKIDRAAVVDEESRSLFPSDYLYLAKRLSQNYNIIFFGEQPFQLQEDVYAAKFTCDLRQWGALIEEADYFVGVDSVGQHMAYASNTPGTVIFGSTFPINTSYPKYFQIIENKANKKYSPIRIAGLDCMLSNRLNEPCIRFTEAELADIYNSIVNHLEKKKVK